MNGQCQSEESRCTLVSHTYFGGASCVRLAWFKSLDTYEDMSDMWYSMRSNSVNDTSCNAE